MKKILIALAVLPLAALAQDKGLAFKLSGKTTNLAWQPEWIYLQYRTGGEWKTDSVKAENGSFQFSGKVDEPSLSSIRVKYLDAEAKKIVTNRKRDVVTIFLQPGKIKVSSVDSFSNITVKGSAAHAEYLKLQALAKPYQEKMEPLYPLYSYFAKAKENKAREKVEAVIDSLEKLMLEKVYAEYARKNPSSKLAMYAIQQFAGWELDSAKIEKLEPLFAGLSESNKKLPSAGVFLKNLEIAKNTAIGRIAMDFTQNDTLGVPVSLASFRGKYVLIDFWASWCGPCRVENPNVVKVFQKYRDKGFHIIGISLDRPGQKEKWMKAIHDDNLTWTQLSDLKFWDNEVAKQYGIQAIPQNLLLDPEGRIIAKNVRGDELDTKVGEAIEGKKAF
jgi:peroxiredoxin